MKLDYGLLFLVALAEEKGRKPLPLRRIAAERHLPYRFLSQIAAPLRNAGLIEAKEGARGGYRLAKSPRSIPVGNILRILEGGVRLVRCNPGTQRDCPSAGACSLAPFWHGVNTRLTSSLQALTLADLLHSRRER
ncbi:MAG: Rrf2 family transcriptional regulator [bacterium]